jgi:hypothetical protein
MKKPLREFLEGLYSVHNAMKHSSMTYTGIPGCTLTTATAATTGHHASKDD